MKKAIEKQVEEILHKHSTIQIEPPKDTETRNPKTLRAIFASILGALTVFGAYTGAVSLIQKVTVTESEPLDPADPSSTKFLLTNEGPFDMTHIHVICTINDLSWKNVTDSYVKRNEVWDSKTTAMNKERLEVGQRAIISCPFTRAISFGPVRSADITLHVNFRLTPIFWWEKHRPQRFVTAPDSNSILHWYPEASINP